MKTEIEQNHNDYCWSFCVEHGSRLIDCDCPCHETEKDRIEKVLADHALVGERYIREKRERADVCRCGSLHPQFGGRWPTHRQHVAEQIARATSPGGGSDD